MTTLFGCGGGSQQPKSTVTTLDPEGVFTPRRTTPTRTASSGTAASASSRSNDATPSDDDLFIDDSVLPESGGWSILLESFPGRDQLALARQRLPVVVRLFNRSDIHIRAVNHGYAIAMGAYDNPNSASAERDLDVVRRLRVGDMRPYAGAWMIPPRSAVVAGDRPEMNLAYARRTWPQARYSLQVEVWEAPSGSSTNERARFRKTAEERAFEIRQTGDPAFYFHGPNRSMVTVGLFSADDYDDRGGPTAVRSPVLRDLMERYPLNLMNGMELLETNRQSGRAVERRQRSMLIHVP